MPNDSQRHPDRQANTDLSLARLLVIAVIVGIVFGAAVLVKGDVLLQSFGPLVAVLAGALVSFYVLDVLTRRRWKSLGSAELSEDRARIEDKLFDDWSQGAGAVGQPRVLDYRTPGADAPRRRHPLAGPIRGVFEIVKFCAGIAMGIGIALVAMQQAQVDAVMVASLIVFAGILCLFKRGLRSLGVGLILSIPLGILTILTLCFAAFK